MPPTYTRVEVKRVVRALFTMRERCDNKEIQARVLDLCWWLPWLMDFYPDEYEAVVICGLFGVPFRDAEEMLHTDHVTIKSRFDSGIAHLTDSLNGEE